MHSTITTTTTRKQAPYLSITVRCISSKPETNTFLTCWDLLETNWPQLAESSPTVFCIIAIPRSTTKEYSRRTPPPWTPPTFGPSKTVSRILIPSSLSLEHAAQVVKASELVLRCMLPRPTVLCCSWCSLTQFLVFFLASRLDHGSRVPITCVLPIWPRLPNCIRIWIPKGSSTCSHPKCVRTRGVYTTLPDVPVVWCHPCSDGIFVFFVFPSFPFPSLVVCVFLCVQALFAAAMDKMGIQNTDQVRLQARPSMAFIRNLVSNCCSYMILAHPFNALCFSFFCSSSQSIQHDTTHRSWFMAEKETSGLLGFGVCSNCMV